MPHGKAQRIHNVPLPLPVGGRTLKEKGRVIGRAKKKKTGIRRGTEACKLREVYRRATTEPSNAFVEVRLVRGVIQAKIVAEPAGKRADCACCIRPHSPGVGEDHRRADSLRAANRGVGRGVAEPEEEPQLVADRLVEANAH